MTALLERIADLAPEDRRFVLDGLTDADLASLEAELGETDTLPLLEWTERHRQIAGDPLKPSALPWLRDLYALTSEETPEAWVMKASQVFISEWMVSTALWVADTRLGRRGNALYVFPKERQMQDFVHARVDTAIAQSDYLSLALGAVDNVGLKQLGRGWCYFRGSDQRQQIISVDADALLLDEVDEFASGTVDTAKKRLNSARAPMIRGGSTPKYPANGIAAIYETTTRRRYHLKCAACAHWQHLRFPENLTEGGRLICEKCGGGLERAAEGEWVAEFPDKAIEGYHVNRLYSPRTDLIALAKLGYLIQEGITTNPQAVQEFHNQDLGIPHAPAGGSLTDDVLNSCLGDYGHPASVDGDKFLGVDVGTVKHLWVKGITPEGKTRLLEAATVREWAEVKRYMHRYQIKRAVVDAMPEDHDAAAFVAEFPGRAFRCFYPNMTQWRHAEAAVWNHAEGIVQAHRTRSLDATFDRFYHQREELPREAQYLPGVYAQLKAPIRVIAQDAEGHAIARYDEGGAADHYAHAANYCELAHHGYLAGGLVSELPTEIRIKSSAVTTGNAALTRIDVGKRARRAERWADAREKGLLPA